MTLTVFLAVLAAAFLHAFWNALIKVGANKQTGMLILTLGHGLISLFVVPFRPFPAGEVWPWLVGSGLIHCAYQLFLAYAYEQGDLSRVYPIARGAAPMIVLLVSLAFLADPVTGTEYAGVIVLGCGIALMAAGVFRNGESRRMLPFALGSACATAGYSLVDGLGARVSGDPLTYIGWLFILSGLIFTPVVIALKGPRIAVARPRVWAVGLFAAALSWIGYAIAVWAMTQAPIALVTALRETSILFAVLIGWLVFGERMDRLKATAALAIVAGVVLTRL
jgi:drug/metabolite transporter (DMT)-like permease